MGITVNQELLDDDVEATPDGKLVLPDGVYDANEWDTWLMDKKLNGTKNEVQDTRVELFRVNDRVYTASKRFDPQVMFRYMRSARRARGTGDDILPVADLMYGVLGEPVMDALADEKLTEEEFAAVMKVVEKHTAGLAQKALGK